MAQQGTTAIACASMTGFLVTAQKTLKHTNIACKKGLQSGTIPTLTDRARQINLLSTLLTVFN